MSWDIVGHEWAVELLSAHLVKERVRHAYLLAGPPGVGRRTLALRLAQALYCSQPVSLGQPCAMCESCLRTQDMTHPDLAVVQAEAVGGTLKVDQVRALQHTLALKPYQAPFRVALLLRFEEAHLSAANALLKTLEEPPPRVILILTAESPETLLPTIVSRCETIRLRSLPLQMVSQALQERWGVPPDRARLLAHLSAGRPGYALQLQRNPGLLKQRQTWLQEHIDLLSANLVERFAYLHGLSKDREALRGALQAWLSLWRDVLLNAASAAVPVTNLDWYAPIEQLAAQTSVAAAHQVVKSLEHTLALLEKNINARLAAEILALDLPTLAASAPSMPLESFEAN